VKTLLTDSTTLQYLSVTNQLLYKLTLQMLVWVQHSFKEASL